MVQLVILLLTLLHFSTKGSLVFAVDEYGQVAPAGSFGLFVLGAFGGPIESRVSGYLLGTSGGIACFDCGVLRGGLRAAAGSLGAFFRINDTWRDIHRNRILSYFVSHAHLDHVEGVIIASPDDMQHPAKPLCGLNQTLANLHDHAFNNKLWPDLPSFGYYVYNQMIPGKVYSNVGGLVGMQGLIYPVSHGPGVLSSCFLIGSHLDNFHSRKGDAVLLCGDLGSDQNEGHVYNAEMWKSLAPLVASRRLRAILIECSFPSGTPVKSLFGHLTPELVIGELHTLLSESKKLHSTASLRDIKVVVSHMKENDLDVQEWGVSKDCDQIEAKLNALNDLEVDLIFSRDYVGQGLRF